MFPIPSSLAGHKRKLEAISCWAQIFFIILCTLVHANQAGVIKKRDTAITATSSGNIDSDLNGASGRATALTVTGESGSGLDLQEAAVVPNNNASLTITTKLQTVVDPIFATEASKELSNNEILINETKNVLGVADKISETILITNGEEENSNSKIRTTTKPEDFRQIVGNLGNVKEKLKGTPKTTTEFSSNDIKEEKNQKLMNRQLAGSSKAKVDSTDYENSSSLENTLKIGDTNPRPPSKILTELRSETEKQLTKLKDQNTHIENSIEDIKNDLKLDNKDDSVSALEDVTIKPFDETTPKTITNSSETSQGEERVVKPKNLETFSSTSEISQLKPMETSTEVPKVAVIVPFLQTITIAPLKDSGSKNKIKFLESETELDNAGHQSNKILQDLDGHLQSKPNEDLVDDKLKPLTTEQDQSVFEGNKKEHARSMFMEETTTSSFRELNELLTPVTTFKPIILSIKQGVEETTPDSLRDQVGDLKTTNFTHTNAKEKKPKFISDNSTNAQQLNLPHNAEVWSLAAMKSLPKANNTIETAQSHNQTNQELQESIRHNSSLNLNNNSEKNLLDWSQIMMDKELSTTTRNEDDKNVLVNQNILRYEQSQTDDLNSAMDTTTLMPEIEVAQIKMQSSENTVTKNSLMENELSTSTISPVSTSKILSNLNYNENAKPSDKKVEESMNNHIDMFAATQITTTTTTTTAETTNAITVATNVDNNPFNTSMNIEPNLNEINLTSNQTQVDLNNDVHNITPSGKKNVYDDVGADADANANISIGTHSVPATTTPASTAKATAVVDMTTIEKISSETTTVSTLETTTQYTSLNNGNKSQQKQNENKNKISNVIYEETLNSSLPILHNELENSVSDKQNNQNEIIDLNTKTTTVVPITTFRPTILAIRATVTTSPPATFEQEVDQNNNEIQTNLKNAEQQSIIKTDLYGNQSTKTNETHLMEREFETTTTTLETLTTTTQIKAASQTENTNSLTTTATSFSKDEIIDETTEIYVHSSQRTSEISTQATPKQVDEHKNTGVEVETATTGSSVPTDANFEKENKTKTAAEINSYFNTSTGIPVTLTTDSEGDKTLNENVTPTTTTATTTTTTTTTHTTEQNIVTNTIAKQETDIKENVLSEEDAKIETTTKAIMNKIQEITTTATPMPSTTFKEEETHISLLDDKSTTTTTHSYTYSSTISTADTTQTPTNTMAMTTAISTTTTATRPTTISSPSSSSTLPSAIPTKVEEIYNVFNSTTTELIKTTTQQLLTEIEKESPSGPSSTTTSASTHFTEVLPPATTTRSSQLLDTADIGKALPTLNSIMGVTGDNMYPKNSEAGETDVNVIIAITVSVIGVVALILLVGFLYLMRKRQKQTSYSQRCRPVSLDEYTIDNASVSGSMRKSSALRASKRTYGNLAFDDPALRPNPMGVHELAKFAQEKLHIFEEFRDVPQITSRLDEVPTGCEDKNRYANVLPLPETRVILQRLNDDEKSEYINANYVTGPKDPPNYYIACQAPLESTVEDFWRMIWEQQSRVIIQATDLIENGVEKCAEYLPPSATLDNHASFGDFQITLQNREVKDKYAISTILLKRVGENVARELTHYWYKWPEVGVPAEEAPIIAMLLEARSSLISYAIEQANDDKEKTLKSAEEGTVPAHDSTALPANISNGSSANGSSSEINGNISMVPIKKTARNQGPLTIHCSPGTGRTGTIIACDVAIRSLETPKRTVDIPQIVYYVRRGRASAVLTKEQYEFIYKVANMYAAKITNPTNYN